MLPELLHFKVHADERGSLIALEKGDGLPFSPVRVCYIDGASGVRGCHAHYDLQQALVSLRGACTVLVDDGDERREVRLESPDVGLYIENVSWVEMRDFTDDCLLMLLASAPYDEANYIRDYESFRQAAAEKRKR